MADTIKTVYEISADLTRVQGQLRTLEGNFDSAANKITSSFKAAGAQLAGFFSVAALVGFAKHVVDVGDQLSDLADQTGHSIEVLGGIKPVLEQNNTSLESFATGIARAQRSLGDIQGSGKEAAEGLKAIGLSASELAGVSPDEFLERFALALSKVENRNERAAIAMRVLGKSAAELIPAILVLADNGLAKLDEATANSYRELGALKDQLTALGAGLTNLAAGPIAGFIEKLHVLLRVLHILPKTTAESLEGLKGTVKNLTEKTGAALDIDPAKIALFDAAQLERLGRDSASAAAKGTLTGLLEARRQLDAFVAKTPFSPPKTPATQGALKNLLSPKGLLPGKKEQDETRSFLDSLNKQLDQIGAKSAGLLLGEHSGLSVQLDNQLKQVKEKLRAEGKPIPAGLDAEFARLKTRVLEANQELTILEDNLKNTHRIAQSFADDANEGVGIQIITPEQNRRIFEANQQLQEMRQSLQLAAIDTRTPGGAERKRNAEFEVEFGRTANRITELSRAAGATEVQIANDVALAREGLLLRINETTESANKFQERSFERLADAFGDISKDLISGQIKGWEDLGKRALSVIQSILSEYIAANLKIQLLGENFGSTGKGGSQAGGLFGSFLSLFGGGASSSAGSAAAAGGGAEILEQGLGFIGSAIGFHQGGLVGRDGTTRYGINPHVFAFATRYHSGGMAGLRMNEVPAILQKGEMVLPRGATGQTSIVFNVNATDAGSFKRSERAIARKLQQNLSRLD